jgi:hypothetical protein
MYRCCSLVELHKRLSVLWIRIGSKRVRIRTENLTVGKAVFFLASEISINQSLGLIEGRLTYFQPAIFIFIYRGVDFFIGSGTA